MICNIRIRTSRDYEVHMTSQNCIKYNIEIHCQLCNKDFFKRNTPVQSIFSVIQTIPFFSRILASGHLNIAAKLYSMYSILPIKSHPNTKTPDPVVIYFTIC